MSASAKARVNPRFTDMIPQYDGTGDFAEWVKKLELVAKLQGVCELENFLPLFLVGEAFLVYDALSSKDQGDYVRLRSQLCRAFSSDMFSAYDKLLGRRYTPGESVDVYLADLTRLGGLIGSPENLLKCAFISGLPSEMRSQLKAAAALEAMTLPEVVERARAIAFDGASTAMVARNNASARFSSKKTVSCFFCNGPNHIARFCPSRQTRNRGPCFRCGENGHVAANCPTKEQKNE